MLLNIFYFIGLLIVIINLVKLKKYSNWVDTNDWVIKFNKVTGKQPKKTDFKSEDEYNLLLGLSFLMFVEFLWLLLGVTTQNWIIFSSLILISLALNQVFKVNMPKIQKVVGSLFIIIKIIFVIIMVLNHFHFQKDLQSFLFN